MPRKKRESKNKIDGKGRKMKKEEIIKKLMYQEDWEHNYTYFARKGMERSTKEELLKWLSDEE